MYQRGHRKKGSQKEGLDPILQIRLLLLFFFFSDHAKKQKLLEDNSP